MNAKKKNTIDPKLRNFRVVTISGGALITIFAIFADYFGFGRPGSFGIGQFILLAIGVGVILVGFLGVKKTVKVYQATAVLILNTVILLALIELGAIVISRVSTNYTGSVKNIPYYADKEWTDTYFQEAFTAETFQYKPFLIWGHLPFSGDTMNLNEDGFRNTPGSDCTADSYKVFVFGGSTLLGWGSPDWGTIPAYLQTGFAKEAGTAICVVNYGQSAYVSTQGVINLMYQLRANNVPDMVIFYDGVNEVQAAYESGIFDGHINLDTIASGVEERESILVRMIKTSRTFAMISKNAGALAFQEDEDAGNVLNYRKKGVETGDLADAITGVYLENYAFVSHLAEAYGFDFAFFVQPHLAVGGKSLTSGEEEIKAEMDPALLELASAFYKRIESEAAGYDHLWDVSSVFDGTGEQVWIDGGGHVTPDGNRIVAEKMMELIWP